MVAKFKANDDVIFRCSDAGKGAPVNAKIVRLLTTLECDIDDVGIMYEIELTDGTKEHAFQDELSTN